MIIQNQENSRINIDGHKQQWKPETEESSKIQSWPASKNADILKQNKRSST